MKNKSISSIFWGSKGVADDEESDSAALFNTFVESINDMVFIKDSNSLKYLFLNKAGERLLGCGSKDVLGKTDRELFSAKQASSLFLKDEEVLKNKKTIEVLLEPLAIKKRGSKWIHSKIIPILDLKGSVKYLLGVYQDVTDLKNSDEQKVLFNLEHKARLEAEQTSSKLTFLSEVSSILSASLDYTEAVKGLAGVIIPYFADWYAVHEFEKAGASKICICCKEHFSKTKSSKTNLKDEVQKQAFGPFSDLSVDLNILISDVKELKKSKDPGSRTAYETLKALGITSYICVPIKVRNKTIGALTLGRDEFSSLFSDEDLKTAQELSARVSIAHCNSSQYMESQRLNRLKDEFLSTMSHELRTPLNVVLGHAEMLAKNQLSPEEVQYSVDAIYRNSKLQSSIVENLLDVSEILNGSMKFRPMPLDPRSALFTTINALKQTADLKSIDIQCDIHEAPAKIIADPLRLREAFWNLLMNAVKYSDGGSKIIIKSSVSDRFFNIVITDTGRGISPQFLPHVFERFSQEDSTITRKEGGLGVGLSIVKGIVELHGGAISVHSEGKGKGATFTIKFPLIDSELVENSNRKIKTTGPIPQPHRKEVLNNI